MSQIVKKQDLPPPGGYGPIPFQRIKAKSLFSSYALWGGAIAIQAFSLYIYSVTHKEIKRDQIEMRSSTLAILPLLLAERDREHLKQLRKNRAVEEKLMENVEGWKVGTYFGEPIYKTYPAEKFYTVNFHEYYAHATNEGRKHRVDVRLWT